MKGGRKNWDEHETTTTNDTPQEGRNNRRTLLITGGKLGCRPIVSRALWERVQERLRERAPRRAEDSKTQAPQSPLAGKLIDESEIESPTSRRVEAVLADVAGDAARAKM